MAGIGFELRKLKGKGTLLSSVQTFMHSTLISSGPWLFTVLSLSGIVLIGSKYNSPEALSEFRLIIIYNFAFSLVIASPIIYILTRYLSDLIYSLEVEDAPGMLIGGIILLFSLDALFAGMYYFFIADLSDAVRAGAFVNFLLISSIWLTSIFLSALKEYKTISFTFFIGMFFSFIFAAYFSLTHKVAGMLWGFNIGLGISNLIIISLILLEYPYSASRFFSFFPHFYKHRHLALSGFFYSLAIWADKWVMWLAPDRQVLPSGMISFPIYDSAMFLAYLSIIPSMAFFIVATETDFFEKYLDFYDAVKNHGTLRQIKEHHQRVIASIQLNARNFIVLQGSITYVCILLAPNILDYLSIGFLQLSIFRFGLLGSFFHVLVLFLTIILSYFDQSKLILKLHILFFATNFVFSYISLKLGFAYYGYGYFLSTLVTAVVTYFSAMHLLVQLPYFAFVKGNSAVT